MCYAFLINCGTNVNIIVQTPWNNLGVWMHLVFRLMVPQFPNTFSFELQATKPPATPHDWCANWISPDLLFDDLEILRGISGYWSLLMSWDDAPWGFSVPGSSMLCSYEADPFL